MINDRWVPPKVRFSGSSMQISFHKVIRIAALLVLAALTSSTAASAQTGDFLDSFTPPEFSYRTSEVEALYDSNAQLPLGGFFAKGFTRTFTLLGGGNFTAADLPGDFSAAVLNPGSFFNQNSPVDTDPLTILPQQDPDVGYVISLAMGRRHNRRLRSEFEFAIRGNDQDLNFPGFFQVDVEADVNAYSLMKNVLFDFPNQSRFTPYLGAGLGISLVEVEAQVRTSSDITFLSPTAPPATSEVSEDDAAFTYQFIGGVATRINHAMDFVVEYRFLGTSDIELDTLGSAPYLVNNLFMGVKLEY